MGIINLTNGNKSESSTFNGLNQIADTSRTNMTSGNIVPVISFYDDSMNVHNNVSIPNTQTWNIIYQHYSRTQTPDTTSCAWMPPCTVQNGAYLVFPLFSSGTLFISQNLLSQLNSYGAFTKNFTIEYEATQSSFYTAHVTYFSKTEFTYISAPGQEGTHPVTIETTFPLIASTNAYARPNDGTGFITANGKKEPLKILVLSYSVYASWIALPESIYNSIHES